MASDRLFTTDEHARHDGDEIPNILVELRQPTPALREFASSLVWGEVRTPGSDGIVEATERVLGAFSAVVTPLVGKAGFHLLLSTALLTVRREHPAVLRTASVGRNGEGYLVGLGPECPDALAGATTALLIGIVVLMTRFFGPEAASRVMRQAFQHLREGASTAAASVDGPRRVG